MTKSLNINICFKEPLLAQKALQIFCALMGIQVFDLNQIDEVTIYIDGADETNPQLELIKGGGAALTREKIVTCCC